MKKLLLLLAFSLVVLVVPNAQARNSAAAYDNKFYSQQEFVQGYNNSTGIIYRDFVVGLDLTPSVNPNNNLGQYITASTSSTTDNINVFGVADETIPAGQLGRICIRGPHKTIVLPTIAGQGALTTTAGTMYSQCANNVVAFNPNGASSTTVISGGFACPFSTASGTAAGMIGYILKNTATTDSGDVGQSTNAQSFTTGSEYWMWIDPQILR